MNSNLAPSAVAAAIALLSTAAALALHWTAPAVVPLVLRTGIIGTVLASGAALLVQGNRPRNMAAIGLWLDQLDTVVAGQRWRGARAEVLYPVNSHRCGLLGYRCDVVCVTLSGRYFRFSATSSLGEVKEWLLTPLSLQEAMQLTGRPAEALAPSPQENAA